jgi:hypothetical protein
MIAKQKLIEMEKQIHHMFIYGDLQHLGMDGYKDFIKTRREIKAKREKMIYEQMRRRQKFVKNLINGTLIFTIVIISAIIISTIITIVYPPK